MTIYICTHKKIDNKVQDSGYKYIYVGEIGKQLKNGITDCHDDNIAELNPYFNEITALYWIWKNTNDNIVGLVHYRRFFVAADKKNNIGYDKHFIANSNYFNDELHNVDVILRTPSPLKYPSYFVTDDISSCKDNFECHHMIYDIYVVRSIIKRVSPNYIDAFDYIMESKILCMANMFVMKRIYFNEYMEWLIPILFEIKNEIHIDGYDAYNKRSIGFLSERLFNVWLCHNKYRLKIKLLDYVNIENPKDHNKFDQLKNKKILKNNKRREKIIFITMILIIILQILNFLH